MSTKYQSPTDIGKRIKELRIAKGITQQQLASIEDLRVQRNLVNYWENGERDIKSHHIIALADYFDVTCDYILCGVSAENIDINKKLGLSDKSISELCERHNKNYIEVQTLDYLLSNSLFWNLIIRLNNYIISRIEDKQTDDSCVSELPRFAPLFTEKGSVNVDVVAFALQKTLISLQDKAFEDLKDNSMFNFAKEIIKNIEDYNKEEKSKSQITMRDEKYLVEQANKVSEDLRRGKYPSKDNE